MRCVQILFDTDGVGARCEFWGVTRDKPAYISLCGPLKMKTSSDRQVAYLAFPSGRLAVFSMSSRRRSVSCVISTPVLDANDPEFAKPGVLRV